MYTTNVIIDDVIDALVVLLTPFLPGGDIVRAQVNRVPTPLRPTIVLTELLAVDLSVPSQDYQPLANTASVTNSTRLDIQIDFYADNAGDICKAVQNVMRSTWGFDQFPSTVKPLYTSDGVQSPMVSAEQQWESRWTLTVSMQYNPIIVVPQQFAGTLTPVVHVPADLT